jgi:hypothetical protein
VSGHRRGLGEGRGGKGLTEEDMGSPGATQQGQTCVTNSVTLVVDNVWCKPATWFLTPLYTAP